MGAPRKLAGALLKGVLRLAPHAEPRVGCRNAP